MSEAAPRHSDGRAIPSAATRVHSALILALLVLLSVRLLLPALRDDNFGITSDANGGGWTSDFAAILTFADAFWRGEAGYDVESYLRVTRARTGRWVEHALPFPYSPTMLWILGPFCLVPAAWSYVLWSLLGVGVVWWMTRPPQSIWLTAAFFTPTAFACFKLGQTAMLTTAGLLLLMCADFEDGRRTHSAWFDAIVLWALTAKPPVALTAGAVLVIDRRWRAVALAVGLTLVSTTLLTPLLGLQWISGYLNLMTHYDLDTADPVYVWSLVPQTMGNLRALLHVTLGVRDSMASLWSGGLWLIALSAVVAGGLRHRLRAEACWGLAVLAYLLFCPHVTAMEELHLVLVLMLFVHPERPAAYAVRWTAIGMTLLPLYLAAGLGYRGSIRLPTVFADKVLLAGLILSYFAPTAARDSKRVEAH